MGSQGAAFSQIQTLYEGSSVIGLTDAQLVERFANDSGERAAVAFSALVERHGPMVMRVCRASLRNEHDAEDAFQAVFLVLVRKAGTLWVRDSLGPWLHTIAVRTSAYARAQSQRRHVQEQRLARTSPETVESTDDDHDLITAIHEEVGRLPDRFREAVVLCDLEGLSHERAAARLGWPVGTVKSRQARGRERLRGRLARRGLAPADAAIAMALAPLPVPVSLVSATAHAASAGTAGASATAGTVSAASEALARGMLRRLTMNGIKLSILSILAAGTIVTGALAFTGGRLAADDPPTAPRREGPTAGSLLQLRIAADPKHDPEALTKPGYRWVKIDPGSRQSLDGLITKVDPAEGRMILVKLDPQNVTERDLREVKETPDERGRPMIAFWLTQDGSTRFGALTKAHLPEDQGAFRYHLALIVEGTVVALPVIQSEIRDAGVIQFGDHVPPGKVDRLLKRLADAAASNAPAEKKAEKPAASDCCVP
jgi:RNA polymerase sigma factor (sigma-70 family)